MSQHRSWPELRCVLKDMGRYTREAITALLDLKKACSQEFHFSRDLLRCRECGQPCPC